MPLAITQVDAFADRPFAGNPAAVCLLERFPADAWMQAVAAEMNLAETAFLAPRDGGEYALRWFTPTVEVDLCGHATLAAAHVLWESGRLDPAAAARFATRSGPLKAARGADGWIILDFPAQPIGPAHASHPGGPDPSGVEFHARALGLGPADVVAARSGGADLLVELASAGAVRAARPDFRLLATVEARGVVITARADAVLDPGVDFVSRFFGPRCGVDEDPVTGSAHCALGPFWAERLGRAELVGFQASRRGGVVRVAVAGDRVLLGGRAVTVLRAELAAEADPGRFAP